MHDAYTIGIPVLVILFGIFPGRSDLKEFRAEMNRRLDIIERELRHFHGLTGKLEGRIDAIEKRH